MEHTIYGQFSIDDWHFIAWRPNEGTVWKIEGNHINGAKEPGVNKKVTEVDLDGLPFDETLTGVVDQMIEELGLRHYPLTPPE